MKIRDILTFAAGAVVGGLGGGVAGYVINDLTSQQNPVVVEQIEAHQQQQADMEAFLNSLPAPDAAADGSR